MRLSKKASESIHAKKRLKQRYGLELNSKQLREIVVMIMLNKSDGIEKQSNRVSKHKVRYMGKDIIVLYDKIRKNIITALTEDMV